MQFLALASAITFTLASATTLTTSPSPTASPTEMTLGPPICRTITTEQAKCCPAASSTTVTTKVDCQGCYLETTTVGPVCEIVCPSTQTLPGTATVGACEGTPYSLPEGQDA